MAAANELVSPAAAVPISEAALSAAGMELLKRLLARSPDSDNDNGFCHS
jgi:hypothetical protein